MNVAYFVIILRREWVSLSLVMLTVCQANHRVVHEHTSWHLTKTIMLIHPCQWTDWLYNYQSTRPLHCPSSTWCFDLWNIQDPSHNYLRWLWVFGFWWLGRWYEDVETDHYQVIAFFGLHFHQTSQLKAFLLCTTVHIAWFLRKQGKENLISVDWSVTRYEDCKSSNKHPCPPPLCGWAIGQHRMYSYCLV